MIPRSYRFFFCLGLIVWCVGGTLAQAHETDQYSIPAGREFADMGGYFSDEVRNLISRAVEKTNRRIESSLREGAPTSETERLQSPDTIAFAALYEFPVVIHYVETLEARLHASALRNRYPGLVTAYRPLAWVYHHPLLLLDPTKLVRLGRSSTTMIDGTYLGTDKIVHFVHMGYLYYKEYQAAIARGLNTQEAERAAVDLGTKNNPFVSEGMLLGMLSTGVWSNADLAADYCGMKFFRNLTESVLIRGEMRPPMLVKDGVYWRLAPHVQFTEFFRVFVSDHWDEALNPNDYVFGIAPFVRQELEKRCADLLNWYVDEQGQPMTQAEFHAKSRNLTTYFGENYGFEGNLDELVTIANCCFEAHAPPSRSEPRPLGSGILDPRFSSGLPTGKSESDPRDDLGRTPLWWAARNGDLSAVKSLTTQGDINAGDVDQETPLHAAARMGHLAVVEWLLQQGAYANPRANYALTPLHHAVQRQHREVAAVLIRHRADVNAQDDFGCTPLHDAASKSNSVLTKLMLDSGADPNLRDDHAATTLHRAARAGAEDVVTLLLRRGADVRATNAAGLTPSDEAGRNRHKHIVTLLNQPPQRTALLSETTP